MFFQRPFFSDMSLRNAFSEMERMRQDMDRLMEGFGGRSFGLPTAGVFPLVNLTEDKDGYYVRAELPGLKADELNISATGNTLSISGLESAFPISSTESETIGYEDMVIQRKVITFEYKKEATE